MIPIISIVGRSDSGKTTLIEKLVSELKSRGYRVATVKHDVHGFEVDKEGKDSWRHKKAGADAVLISSPWRVALIQDVDKDHSLEELQKRFIRDVDIIISEGYKRDRYPKIEVFRKGAGHSGLLCSPKDNMIALASDLLLEAGVPCFDINDAKGIVDLIEEYFLSGKKERDGGRSSS